MCIGQAGVSNAGSSDTKRKQGQVPGSPPPACTLPVFTGPAFGLWREVFIIIRVHFVDRCGGTIKTMRPIAEYDAV